MANNWETVIGLEVHVQLSTVSKIFSGAPTSYGSDPNSQACLIDLGFPGTLPVINETAIKMAVAFGLAVNGQIAGESSFARKNYFYPDLPKGYQISQYDSPIVSNGELRIAQDECDMVVPIERAHLEEDAGKSIHFSTQNCTGVDLNRAGTPLLEIVTTPAISSSEDAIRFLKRLRELVIHLGISDGNMQEGSFRCDANISVRPENSVNLGTRAEIKNLNSFRFIENAIEFERKRQISILKSGGKINQETRLYDESRNETRAMRSKENEYDYRYFTDPDLLPLEIDRDFIKRISEVLPELPDSKRHRFKHNYELASADIELLMSDPKLSQYFEDATAGDPTNAKLTLNWITGELFRSLNNAKLKISESAVDASRLNELILEIQKGTVPKSKAKNLFQRMWDEGKSAGQLMQSGEFSQSFDLENLTKLVTQVLTENKVQVDQYLSGKNKVFGFLVGQIMKKSKGSIDPKIASEKLKERLNNPDD